MCFLVGFITKWTIAHDKRLHRLICWTNSSLELSLYAKISDGIDKWELGFWTDSDLSSCIWTKRSTAGCLVGFSAPNTWAPINATAHKATGNTSECTPCAELVALHKEIRTDAMP